MGRQKATARKSTPRPPQPPTAQEKAHEKFQRRAYDALYKRCKLGTKMSRKKVNPVEILPVEVLGMVFRYLPDVRSVVALERVSKGWSEVVRAVCTVGWVRLWGLDVDWIPKGDADEERGWGKFKAEVKSYHNMKLGFPSSGLGADWEGVMLVRDDYIACLGGGHRYGRSNLMIRQKEPTWKDMPMDEQFREQITTNWGKIVVRCGLGDCRDRGIAKMEFFGTGPGCVLLYMGSRPPVLDNMDGVPFYMIACISTETGNVIWARSTTCNEYYYPPSKRTAGQKYNERTWYTPHVIMVNRQSDPEYVTHSSTQFFSYLVSCSHNQATGVEDVAAPSCTHGVKIMTIDLRTGETVDDLAHEVLNVPLEHHVPGQDRTRAAPFSFFPLQNPDLSANEPELYAARYILILAFNMAFQVWTASTVDLLTKQTLASIPLHYPSSYNTYHSHLDNDNTPVSEAFLLCRSGIRFSTLPSAFPSAAPLTIFATFQNTTAPYGTVSNKKSTHHLSFTLRLNSLTQLTCIETNIYETLHYYRSVELHPRLRLAFTADKRETRTNYPIQNGNFISILSYTEVTDEPGAEEDEEAKVLGVRKWRANVWDFKNGPKKLMLLAVPKPAEKMGGLEWDEWKAWDEDRSREVKRLGWEWGERGSREVFEEVKRVGSVGEGWVGTRGNVFWF
ncbi:hypothetical protein BJ508DRAFT_339214 [Ascobolus immersus RN42]|uniref:F-box domain-containing protein n=1 Tax=Ascobolus immersus RN42 TaxID=1160509 RepID=A0A3N4HN17_ASCIM|nr:hypothetical protein BJ508DRAFT_339214 [Ascobolus immersus RN42]